LAVDNLVLSPSRSTQAAATATPATSADSSTDTSGVKAVDLTTDIPF
jgi:hypothetical protein